MDRQRFWLGRWHCERQYRYLDSRRVSWGRWDTSFRALTLVGLIGAGSTLAVVEGLTWQTLAGGTLALLGVVSAVMGLVGDYTERAVASKVTAGQFSLLSTEWQRLWRELEELPSSEAHNLVHQAVLLEKFQAMLDAYSDQSGWTDDKLSQQATDEATKLMEQEATSVQK